MDPVFVYGNSIEAVLWMAMGILALVRRNSAWSYALAAAFLAFGVSDIVEVRTGAWYEPWWLLAWKALCIGMILACGIQVYRAGKRGRS